MSRTRPLLALAAPLALVTLLAGCSGGAGADEPAVTTAPSASAGANGNGNGTGDGYGARQGERGPGGGGGVSGQIAQVDDSTMQVRGTDGQTTVTWSGDTTFSATSTGALTDVAVGSCIVAITGGMPSADSTATPAADDAVRTVAVSAAASDGTCTPGLGGGGGFGGGGFGGGAAGTPGQRPSGAPTDLPSAPGDAPTGMPGAGPRGFGGFTSGKVTAVSGTTITVDATDPSGETASTTVTVDDSTTYTTTAKASAASLAVGACATVQGKTDTKGAVAATRIVVSKATDGTCSTGFGGGFGGRGGQPGQGDGAGDDSNQGSADA
ncbi:DUF5666 domain-containing protein [Cellulomonas edaphi]|uniref:DUF5666 domain-containing protein n=1 Tax=Cellulomonas edaphi TaxID=3053468 RepID=A0ABT7S9G0_9CELL|nr:DUF5666 domain-containing protein [Cellulomons edaphi]MDM7832265.1 DUF5666 domain-containing protein [Cellulomons edaphi]